MKTLLSFLILLSLTACASGHHNVLSKATPTHIPLDKRLFVHRKAVQFLSDSLLTEKITKVNEGVQ